MDEAGHDHPVPGLLPRLWLPDDQLQPGPGLCLTDPHDQDVRALGDQYSHDRELESRHSNCNKNLRIRINLKNPVEFTKRKTNR